jgi:hypothetical protein
LWFSSLLPGKCWINTLNKAITASFLVLTSLFIRQSVTWCYMA